MTEDKEPPAPDKAEKTNKLDEELSKGIKDGFKKTENEPLPEELVDLLKKLNDEIDD